jgi:hypothetical protein
MKKLCELARGVREEDVKQGGVKHGLGVMRISSQPSSVRTMID